ncbi:MAG: heavy metal translocating P-type ATPase [Thermoanaerobaculia bacterium]
MTRERWAEVAHIVVTGAVALLYARGALPLPWLLLAVAFGLYPLARTGARKLIHEHQVGTEVFIVVATVIAMLGGEYVAGSVLMVIILIAELIAELNTDRARASIKGLIGSVPQTALVRRNGGESTVPVAEIRAGEIVIVRAGEKIPVDGIVRAGAASVNQAPITGESVPQEKVGGAPVYAGTVVDLGALDIETQHVGGDTMYSRIVALVETAQEQKATVQKLADRVAAWLIPAVFVFLLGVYLVTRDVRMVITLLVFTSPAELGLATPLVIIAAVARAAHSGILLKGGIVLEQLASVDVLAIDKTGTLTFGKPQVVRIDVEDGSSSEESILRVAASVERRSSHPLAEAIVRLATDRGVDLVEPTDFTVVPGRGVRAAVDGRSVLVGNASFLSESGFRPSPPSGDDQGLTAVYILADARLLGVLHLADRVRPNAKAAIALLKTAGIKRVVMLTGDNAAVARRVGAEVGIEEVLADLLPADKLKTIQLLQSEGHRVAMVGDGINDAPALAQADVGIAMGVVGTQAAIEAADVALMTDDIGKIAEARAIAARAYRTIKENLFFGVGLVHVLGIAAALLRLIGPIEAAVIHLGPDVLVFLNSVKLLRVRIPGVARQAVSP